MEWIRSHWVQIGTILLALHTLLKAITRMTETKADDTIVDNIGKVLKYLFLGKNPK